MWDAADRERIYFDGLCIRAVVAGSFAAFLLGWAALGMGELIPGLWWIQLVTLSLVAINPLLWLAGRKRGFPLSDFYCHWAVDVLAVTLVAYLLGDFASPLAPVAYMIMIVSSAAFMTMRAALVLAAMSAVAWGGMNLLIAVSWLPRWEFGLGVEVGQGGKWMLTGATLMFLFLFAYVAGTVAEKLRSKAWAVTLKQRELENALVRETAARRESQSLAAIVQHDVYGPLGAIEGVVDDIRDGLKRGEWRDVERVLFVLEGQLRSAEAAVESLGLFAEEQAQLSVDLREVASALIADLEPAIHAKEAVVVGLRETALVAVGRDRCYHVLRNLLSNAIKCVPDGGQGRIVMGGTRGELPGWLWLSVSDNGPGLSDKFIAALTGDGRPAPRERRRDSGLGVGLHLVRELVASWGGIIRYERSSEGGAAVLVAFPEASDVGG